MANILRTPKSKERFGDCQCSVDEQAEYIRSEKVYGKLWLGLRHVLNTVKYFAHTRTPPTVVSTMSASRPPIDLSEPEEVPYA